MKTVYFLGIGGIGMSALARYYHSQGCIVAGYDRTRSPLTTQLEDEGMAIHYEDDPTLLPALINMVIYTPAVPHGRCQHHPSRPAWVHLTYYSNSLRTCR